MPLCGLSVDAAEARQTSATCVTNKQTTLSERLCDELYNLNLFAPGITNCQDGERDELNLPANI